MLIKQIENAAVQTESDTSSRKEHTGNIHTYIQEGEVCLQVDVSNQIN